MELFTMKLVSNASTQIFLDNTLGSFTNFLPEQLNLEGQCEVVSSELTYPSMYQNITPRKFMLFDKKHPISSEFYFLEHVFYPSITDNVETMNTLIQERHKHSESCITVKMSQKTQTVEIYLADEGSGLAFLVGFRTHFQ